MTATDHPSAFGLGFPKSKVDLASEIFETARVMNLVHAAQLQKP